MSQFCSGDASSCPDGDGHPGQVHHQRVGGSNPVRVPRRSLHRLSQSLSSDPLTLGEPASPFLSCLNTCKSEVEVGDGSNPNSFKIQS